MIRRALALREVEIINMSSIKLSLILGGQVGWTMKRSFPRTSSSISMTISPSAKRPIYKDKTTPNHFYIDIKTYSARTKLSTKLLDNFFSERTVSSTREDSQVALNTFYKYYINDTKIPIPFLRGTRSAG